MLKAADRQWRKPEHWVLFDGINLNFRAKAKD
jgi:hypothetical protein